MKRVLGLMLAGAVIAGCEKPPDPAPVPPVNAQEPPKMPKPVKEPETNKDPQPPADKPKVERRTLYPDKKGLLAVYKCQCTGKDWTQPAEQEKLCIDYCEGKMPECGELVKEEPAPK
ncbi:MAG: hypothetical protein HYY18_21380 [Planctomycetes bacterium]|nr:hypothetical protein [Planctomycetota bacterium]